MNQAYYPLTSGIGDGLGFICPGGPDEIPSQASRVIDTFGIPIAPAPPHNWTWAQVILVILMIVLYIGAVISLQVAARGSFASLLTVPGNFSAYVALNIATSIVAVSIFVVPIIVLISWIGDRYGLGLWDLIRFTYGVLLITSLVSISFAVSALLYSTDLRGDGWFWAGFVMVAAATLISLILLVLSWI
jgi:hypothetical protein